MHREISAPSTSRSTATNPYNTGQSRSLSREAGSALDGRSISRNSGVRDVEAPRNLRGTHAPRWAEQ